MKCDVFSYRYGQEILQHDNFAHSWKEIETILTDAPLFIYPGKSKKNSKLDVVQQLMNAYFDRVFVIENKWVHHPLATRIEGSELTADYRKKFDGVRGGSLEIQVEVQFGNMARFYADVFKFQAAYSEKAIQAGMSVIPRTVLAKRIDSNVVSYERVIKELPAAELSITLPIVVAGLSADESTRVVDVSACKFKTFKDIVGKGNADNLRRIVHAYVTRGDMKNVGPRSDTGPPMAVSVDEESPEA